MAIVSTRPGIKTKVGVKFPAQVHVIAPMTLTKTGATYTFGVDLTGVLGGAVWLWQVKMALQSLGNLHTVNNAVPADPTQSISILWGNGARSTQGDVVSAFIKSTMGWNDAQMASLYTLAAGMIS